MTKSFNTAREPRLPGFIGVGPGRTGTTWLYEVLKGRVDMPAGIKETDFFTTNYDKGIQWYAHHFRDADGARPIGEVNPYFGFPEAAERIRSESRRPISSPPTTTRESSGTRITSATPMAPARLARSIHTSASPRPPSASRCIFRDAKSSAHSATRSSESTRSTNSGNITR